MLLSALIFEFVVAIGSDASLSASAREQLKDYLPGGPLYRNGDEIVLLEPKNPNEIMHIENYRSDMVQKISGERNDGHCFGLTQAELALLNIEFKPGLKNNNEIMKSVVNAAHGMTGQVIHGYTAEEFSREMTKNYKKDGNPYRLAVEQLQAEHIVKLEANGALKVSRRAANETGFPKAPVFSNQQIKNAQTQAAEFMKNIDNGLPIWASSFAIDQQSKVMTQVADAGHAFIIMGYIKNKNFSPRLIVKNSNSAHQLRVMDSAMNENNQLVWKDIDTRGSSSVPVPVIVGAQHLSEAQQNSVKEKFVRNSSQSGEVKTASSSKRCNSASNLTDIYKRAEQ